MEQRAAWAFLEKFEGCNAYLIYTLQSDYRRIEWDSFV